MNCNDPRIYYNTRPSEYEGDLSDWQDELLCRHSDCQTEGSQRIALSEHIQNCSSCRDKLDQYQQLNRLATRLRQEILLCPSATALDSYLFHPETMGGNELKRLQQHLEHCASCSEDISWSKRHLQAGDSLLLSSRWRTVLAAAAAVLLIIAAFWGIQATRRARAVASLTAMAELPDVGMSEVDSLPPLQNHANQALLEAAMDMVRQSRFEDALSILQRINTSDSGKLRVLFLEAYSFGHSGNLRRASEVVARIRTCRPGSAPRCWYLANLLIKTHDWDRAQTELDHVLQVDPNNERARQMKQRLEQMKTSLL